MSDFIIVEPHTDDAFLSTHGHILRWIKQGHAVTIVTMPAESRRMREAEAYARKVGADWLPYGGILPAGQLILPLGIRHPDHVSTRQTLETPDAWFYLDMPYALVQRDAELVNDLLRGTEIVSFMKPHGNKFRCLPIFKSQSSYFGFHGRDEQMKSSFEMIVRRK